MAKLIAMYKTPADTAAFDHYYFGAHLKLAKTVPGLIDYDVTRGPVMTLAGPAPYYLIAVLSFASMASLQAALASPQGQATAADLGNFAAAGVDIYLAESEAI
jgi:uncharacterized protein (TIGR02118 family)